MTTRSDPIRLATRGSDLALAQAESVKRALSGRRREVELVTVETTGDRIDDELIHRLGKTGAFVHSLDEKVLAGDVEGAIHSMKDMPTEESQLVVAAVPERATAGDRLVTPDGKPLAELPEGATVGTGSLRRGAQLLAQRPDLTVEPLRGNVDTRVEKLLSKSLNEEYDRRVAADEQRKANTDDDFEPEFDRRPEEWIEGLSERERQAFERSESFDAIVLAAAGLERSGLDREIPTSDLPTESFVPAAGQGALAVTMADGDLAREVNEALDHPRSRVETTVERTVLATLGGGCVAPIGIHAVIQGEHVRTRVQVLARGGEPTISVTRDLPVKRHAEAARELAEELADRGASELIEEAKREATEEEIDTERTDGEETGDGK
ncbi:hydroxymethylbilane synthase [Halalkalicoccus jeotgali]|uniref:Hydroxymethylbilane synthase n=1 Tax=Halalkalicoccus jeotgali (strain DSM 18796 / CECT 7217 / JCM 14584 / KCTC 4019 / B3) TaxID=795797 RepID=D8J4D7_HALJB|nr:hydroxymethylbilane synthase [Halalkalicoccus jeotgali]ADJ13499.1 porphobilinogen deaminase [Halalkalicoccus jeotgali B3]ELY33026.1 porphobilinogen deaminase [Halalkalicoccus jeotgali B3]